MAHFAVLADFEQTLKKESTSPGDADHVDRAQILNQLQCLLSSRFFNSSKRCPAMLSYVVTSVLDGQAEYLKERSIGIEAFHRAADYDSNMDPIVRLTAGEVRKRLAQYYCEAEHENELRISLPVGSYVPEFHWPEPIHTPLHEDERKIVIAPSPLSTAPKAKISRYYFYGGVLVLCAAAGILLTWLFSPRPALERFWGGLLSAHSTVVVCLGQPDRYVGEVQKNTVDSSLGDRLVHLDLLSMGDAVAASRLIGILARKKIAYTLQGEESTSFTDLRRGPTILVSGTDNPWTMRAIENFRYNFNGEWHNGPPTVWITDRKNPASRAWQVDFRLPYTQLSQDYGLVARFNDPTTGQLTMIAAGIGSNGTLAASECLTDTDCMQTILERDPAKGQKNIEAVLGTQVIDGKSGPPAVLAVYSW
jgi:hypothetical protein